MSSSRPNPPPPRRLMVLRGQRADTRRAAERLTANLGEVLWVSSSTEEPAIPPAAVKKRLGSAVDAVVLDLHERPSTHGAGIDANVLGQVEGLIWGGGALILRLPDARWDGGFAGRLERFIADRAVAPGPELREREPLRPPPRTISAPTQQRELIAKLVTQFTPSSGAPSSGAPSSGPPGRNSVITVTGGRGHGKSAAVGLALASASLERPLRVRVVSPDADGAAEVLRHAGSQVSITRTSPRTLAREMSGESTAGLSGDAPPDVLVVDEAARLPIAWLRRVVGHWPEATIVLITTTAGYEGTGRGFVLRFVRWLESLPRETHHLALEHPIRFAGDDPLHHIITRLTGLDATAAALTGSSGPKLDQRPIRIRQLTRDALEDERLLRETMGLLVEAHYRTSPRDLQLIVDETNLDVHAALLTDDHGGEHVVAVTLVAREGQLSREACRALAEGRGRIRGHALPDTLICHSGYETAGQLTIVRSVRIVVHPELRGRGLARRLVDHVHARYDADLFGTLFGATAALVGFRRSVGYELVRVGVARGVRTGEPAAVMLRPATPAGEALVHSLRQDLARELPRQLALMAAEGDLSLAPALPEVLTTDLPDAEPLPPAARQAAIDRYLYGPRPSDTLMAALIDALDSLPDRETRLAGLPPAEAAVIRARVGECRPWEVAAQRAGLANVRLAQRAMRRGLRTLLRPSGALLAADAAQSEQ